MINHDKIYIKVLAFDTSTDHLSAAYFDGKKAVSVRVPSNARHSESLFGTLGRFLARRRARFADVDLFVVGLGPGGFSGLRVGVTAAKTLAYALGKKLAGISSLQAIALNQDLKRGPVCVVRDARKGNVYTATFSAGGAVSAPRLVSAEEFLKGVTRDVRYAGDGLEVYGKEIETRAGRKAVLHDKRLWRPRAASMIGPGIERWKQGRLDEPLTLLPEYLYDERCNVTKARQDRTARQAV